MKKTIAVIAALLLLSGVSGCLFRDEVQPEQQTAGTQDESGNQAPAPENKEQKEGEGKELKTDSGRYVGQSDGRFIEIQISGVPDEKGFRVFRLSRELEETFESLKLETGDNIKFEYYTDETNQNMIVGIEKI